MKKTKSAALAAFGILGLLSSMACGETTVTAPDTRALAILSFAAAPAAITAGEGATLVWTTRDAESCALDGEAVAVTGSHPVSPAVDTTYLLACEGLGKRVEASVTVNVARRVAIAAFTATPDALVAGETTTLTWEAEHAASCSLDGGVEIGGALSGSVTVTPAITTTYTLTCEGAGGPVSRRAAVWVHPALVIRRFAADPAAIVAGASTTLSWITEGAESCVLDQGLGVLADPRDGSLVVTPAETTTYALSCTGFSGTTSAQTTVTLRPQVRIDAFTASPEAIALGEASLLTWTAEHAEGCALMADVGLSPGPVAAAASTFVLPTQDTTYTLSCTGGGASAEQSVGVLVSVPQSGLAITSVTPPFGTTAGGYVVELVGQGFLPGALVSFGSDAAGWVDAAGTQVAGSGAYLSTRAPAHPAGRVAVRVTNPGGAQAVLADVFEFLDAPALPPLAFSAITPAIGPAAGGYDALIAGQGFRAGIRVYFGQLEAPTVVRLGPTHLRVTVPASAAGPVDLRLENPPISGPDEVVAPGAFTFGQSVVLEAYGMRMPIETLRGRDGILFDANGDGLDDVLILRDSGEDLLLLNTAAGTYVGQAGMRSFTNELHRNPVVLDADGDGDLDVVVHWSSGSLALYRNDGFGTLTWESLGAVGAAGATEIAAGDLNCDAVPDLFVARDSAANLLLVGDGAGGFATASGVLPLHNEASRGVALGDVDLDGDLDILIANDYGQQNRLYYNNCNNIPPGEPWRFVDAQYGIAANFPISGFASQDVLLGDVNGDGLPDAVVLNSWQPTRIYLNAGGRFLEDDRTRSPQVEQNLTCREGELVDVDLDGDLDLLVNRYFSGQNVWTYVYTNDLAQGGPGAFTHAPTALPGWAGESSTRIRVGDLNGDLAPDLYVINEYRDDWLLINNGQDDGAAAPAGLGRWVNESNLGLPEQLASTMAVSVGDVDADGDLDVLLVNDDVAPILWHNDGTGAFTVASASLPPDLCPATDAGFVDLNGDGDLDLLVICSAGSRELRQLVNDGTGVFVNASAENLPPSSMRMRLAAGDLDGDGDVDLVLTGYSSAPVQLLINFGDALGNGGAYFIDRTAWLPPLSGYRDALVFTGAAGEENILLVRGGPNTLLTRSAPEAFTDVSAANLPLAGDDSTSALATDLNADGVPDLVIANIGPSRILVGQPDGHYTDTTAASLPFLNAMAMSVAAGDLDGDGRPDLVFAAYNGQNRLALNVGSAAFADFTTSLPVEGDASRAVAIADFDGDGRPDVLVGNSGVSRVYVNAGP